MIFLLKYQNNQSTELFKSKTRPFSSLDITYNLLEEVFRRKNPQEERFIF